MKDQIFYLHLIHRKRSPFSLWRRLTDFVRRQNVFRTLYARRAPTASYLGTSLPEGGFSPSADGVRDAGVAKRREGSE